MFRVSSTHLQADIVVHKQHMVPSLSIRVLVSCWYAAIGRTLSGLIYSNVSTVILHVLISPMHKKAFWKMTSCSLVGGYRRTWPQAHRLWYEDTRSPKCVCSFANRETGKKRLHLSLKRDENKCQGEHERRRDWNGGGHNQVPDFAMDFFISTAACWLVIYVTL